MSTVFRRHCFLLEKRLFWGDGESLNVKGMEDNNNTDADGLLGHKYRHQFGPNIPVPSKLDVHARNIAVAWRKFKRQWNNYEAVTRLDTESPKYLISVSLVCIGDEAFDIFDKFSFEEDVNQNDSEAVLDKFELFCVAEANEIILCETFLFNKRNQEEGETIDTYVSTLRKLAKTYSFKANEATHAQG